MSVFSFDATVGTSTSNSYVSVTEFTDYFSRFPFDTDIPLDDSNLIERLLTSATFSIDNSINFDSWETDFQSQALKWPRTGLVDERLLIIPNNSIPKRLKNATCLLALWLYEECANDNTSDVDSNPQEVKLGGRANIISMNYKPNSDRVMIPTNVMQELMRIGPDIVLENRITR